MQVQPRFFHKFLVASFLVLLATGLSSLAPQHLLRQVAAVTPAYAQCDDADGDTLCDADDPCPDDGLDDVDGDGKCDGERFNTPKTGGFDNCPDDANENQADSDLDGRGNACDLCPSAVGAAEDLCLTTGFWERRAATINERHEGGMAQVGGLNYVIGGEQSIAKVTEVYDPLTNTWTTGVPLPAKRHHIHPVVVKGKIYVIGGLSAYPGPSFASVLMFDPANPQLGWQTRAPLPTTRGALGCAAQGVKIYCAGGLSSTTGNTAVDVFEVYNTATNTWATLPPMPRPRDHFQAAIVNGRFYAIGGRNTAVLATYPNNDIYDIDTNTWLAGAPLPTPRGGFATAVMQGRILIIGGEGGGPKSGTFQNVEEYDPVRDVWRRLTDIPTGRHGIGVAVSKVEEEAQERAYVATGGIKQGGSKSNLHDVFAYHTKNLVCFAPGKTPGVVAGLMTADAQYTAGADDDPTKDSLTDALLYSTSTVNSSVLSNDRVTYVVNAALPGNWYLWGRFYYPSPPPPPNAHAFQAKFDSGAGFKFGNHKTLYQRFHWDGKGLTDTVQDGHPLGPLQGGPHTIIISKRDVTPIAPRLDMVCLSQSSNVAPTDAAACAASKQCIAP